jgi:hypothetical protein
MWAAVGSAAVALSLLAAFAGNRAPSQPIANPVASATPASVPSPVLAPITKEPEPTRVEDVIVTLRAVPESAMITIDDGPALPNPHTVRQAPDLRTHRVRARLSGYEDREEVMAFDHSREISFALRKLSAPMRRPSAAVVRQSPSTPPTAESAPAEVAVPAKPRLGELPPVVKKPPRTLDEQNPFAK